MKLIERLESYEFSCEAGPLTNCVDWTALKTELEVTLSKLERVRKLLDRWEDMATSPSDHEAGAAIQCQNDLREALNG